LDRILGAVGGFANHSLDDVEVAFDLARMALNILLVLAMSDEPERMLSSASLTLTDSRNRAGIDLIEALEQLKFLV
jgi:hypothetical protein